MMTLANDDDEKLVSYRQCSKINSCEGCVIVSGTRIPDAAVRVMNQIEQQGGDKRKAHA